MDMIHEEKKCLAKTESQVNLRIAEREAENDIENGWDSCCFRLDRRAVMYFTTLGVSMSVMIFCIIKLSDNIPCEQQNGWISLLSLVIGIYIKSPVL